MVKIVRLGRREFRRKFGARTRAVTVRSPGVEPSIHVPGRVNTRTLLHEIYHAKYSPVRVTKEDQGWESVDAVVTEELSAEDFAATKGGGSPGLSIAAITGAGGHAVSIGYSPGEVMGATARVLRNLDYEPLDRKARSYLWWCLRDRETHRRELQ